MTGATGIPAILEGGPRDGFILELPHHTNIIYVHTTGIVNEYFTEEHDPSVDLGSPVVVYELAYVDHEPSMTDHGLLRYRYAGTKGTA